MRRLRGFGLVEALLALSLGVIVIMAGSRLFITAVKTWQTQVAATRLQEDARLALMRLSRDIRMSGMFGCLRTEAIIFADAAAAEAFARPVLVNRDPAGNLRSLLLLVSEAGALSGAPNWTLLTDCLTYAEVKAGEHAAGAGQFALPIRQQVYRVEDGQLLLSSAGSSAVLIEQVARLAVEVSPDVGDPALIQGIHLLLTLRDTQSNVREQTYRLSTALRNRLS